jgi:tetratricopeptide (TPR) repeat protein
MRSVRLRHLLAPALALACAAPRPPPPPAPAAAAPVRDHLAASAAVDAARAARAAGDAAAERVRLQEAVEADPEWDLPRLALAEILLRDEADAAGALALLEGEARGDNPRLPRLRGQALEAAGEELQAAQAYERALALRDDPELRLRRGLILSRIGPRAEAIAELERVRAVRPAEALARGQLADLYEADGRRPEAEAELRWLVAAAPAEPAPLLRLAAFLARAGEPERALAAEQAARALEGPRRALRPLMPARR